MVKPRVPVINWSHPLTKGLVLDMPLFERGGTAPSDIVTKIKGSFIGTPTWMTSILGPGLSYDDGTTDRATITTIASQNNLTRLTVETLAIQNSSITNGARIFQKGVTGIQANRFWEHGEISGGSMFFAGDWTAAQGAWSISAPSSGMVHHIISTYDGSSTANNPIVYVDGVSKSVSTIVSPSGSRGTDSAILYVGGSNNATESWSGIVFLARIYNVIKTKQEVKQLYTNPWQFYVRPKAFMPFTPSAAGGAVYNAMRMQMGFGM